MRKLFYHHTTALCRVILIVVYQFLVIEISLIRAIYGVEREFDRYFMLLKQSLRGNTSYLATNSPDEIIEYAVKRTINRKDAWDEEEHEFEQLDNHQNELICYISNRHRNTIDYHNMVDTLIKSSDESRQPTYEEEKLNKYYYQYGMAP